MQQHSRSTSLDAFRGATVAAMLLVNNPGHWGAIHAPLRHAAWNGWTPTDLVFPFFLFIVGVAIPIAFDRRVAGGASRGAIVGHVVRRGLALALLGYWGGTFSAIAMPPSIDAAGVVLRVGAVVAVIGALAALLGRRPRGALVALVAGAAVAAVAAPLVAPDDALVRRIAHLRVPGVLVRIGVCYVVVAALYLLCPRVRTIAVATAVALAAYWLWMVYVPVPGFGPADLDRAFPTASTPRAMLFSNWCFWVDFHALGEHVWAVRKLRDADGALIWSFDPEGVLSTIPAAATVALGVLAGRWLGRTDVRERDRIGGLVVGGVALAALGWAVGLDFPINKRLWSTSFALFTAGLACLALAVCRIAFERGAGARLAAPFVWHGRNAILVFVAAGMAAQAASRLGVKRAAMTSLFDPAFTLRTDASLAWAIAFVTLATVGVGLLHWRRIYVKL